MFLSGLMKKFIEIQKMPGAFYVLMLVGLIAPVALLLNAYLKATEETKNELVVTIIIITCAECTAFWLISSIRQFTEINKFGIYYSYPPFKKKKNFIPMKEIESFSLEDYNFSNYGYKVGKWNIFRSTPSITMMGLSKVLRIRYENEKVLLIGTKRPEEALEILKYYKSYANELS